DQLVRLLDLLAGDPRSPAAGRYMAREPTLAAIRQAAERLAVRFDLIEGALHEQARRLTRRQPEDEAEWAEIEVLKAGGRTDAEIERRLGLAFGTLAKRRWRRKRGRK